MHSITYLYEGMNNNNNNNGDERALESPWAPSWLPYEYAQ